jgi:hypothetical protein
MIDVSRADGRRQDRRRREGRVLAVVAALLALTATVEWAVRTAAAVGGELRTGPAPGGGFLVETTLPTRSEAVR